MSASASFSLEKGQVEANLEWMSDGGKWTFCCFLSSSDADEHYDGLRNPAANNSDVTEAIDYLVEMGADLKASPSNLSEISSWIKEHAKRHRPSVNAHDGYFGM